MVNCVVKTRPIDEEDFKRFKHSLPHYLAGETFTWGPYRFDVAQALYLVNREKLTTREVAVASWCQALGMAGPKDTTGNACFILTGVSDRDVFLPNVKTTVPLIVAEHEVGKGQKKSKVNLLIDGNKRLRRAYLEGIENLQAYYLPHELVKLIML